MLFASFNRLALPTRKETWIETVYIKLNDYLTMMKLASVLALAGSA